MPTAANITIQETLDLLDAKFSSVSKGVAHGEYALWLGSGISRERVIGLDGVLGKLIEFLRSRRTSAADCRYRVALDQVLSLAGTTIEQLSQIDFALPASDWPCFGDLVARLWTQYSAVISIEFPNEALDYLLWVGLDFPNTFAGQDADAEHLAIGMLALEGVVTDLVTANWDGLLEAALRELGYLTSSYRVAVTGDDLRGPAAAFVLYKFHGCALRAIENEETYRPLLVARNAQIVGWMSSDNFRIMRDQLQALLQRRRTLMVGMSAQDVNIQHLFGRAGAQRGWKWNDPPTPIIFSAQQLGNDQRTVLAVAYGDEYEPNRQAICDTACLPAYAKPLLLALLLSVLTTKLQILASDVSASWLDGAVQAQINHGLKHLRDRTAIAGDGDRLAFAKSIASCVARARAQLQDGVSRNGSQQYYPLDDAPVHQMKNKLALAATGQREAALALGLIGLECQTNAWSTSIDDPTAARSGAMRLTSAGSSARVFFAANDDAVISLMECGAFDEDDADVVLICSRRVSPRQQRNSNISLRSGKVGPRYLSFGAMVADATDFVTLREDFRLEVTL